ncbi:MAG: hypothetical protein Q4F84_10870, partial [Fibrobacter sp.]|nr:hypothetical protein [Fibrobacter sp.]
HFVSAWAIKSRTYSAKETEKVLFLNKYWVTVSNRKYSFVFGFFNYALRIGATRPQRDFQSCNALPRGSC